MALSSGRALHNRWLSIFTGLLSTVSCGGVGITTCLVLGEHRGSVKRMLATYHGSPGSIRTPVDASLREHPMVRDVGALLNNPVADL